MSLCLPHILSQSLVVFICNSAVISNVEQVFTCLPTMCVSPTVKGKFKCFARSSFIAELHVCVLDTGPLSGVHIACT